MKMTWMMLNRRFFIFAFLFSFFISHVLADDWVLAARKFDFTQNKKRDVSEEEFSSLIPQILLEQISERIERNTSTKELMDRTLENLLVERQSLFLQLSKENKKRDSLVLTTSSEKKLKKAIAEQQKKIKEVEDKIDENLKKTSQLRDEYRRENEGGVNKVESDYNLLFNPFTNLFVKKTERMLEDPKSENIVLYKNDPSALYTVSETALKQGPQSRVFEKEMISSKISGMIDGTITVYGSYFSVTCSLYVYPGKNLVGTVTEVGSLRDCASVVRNVAAYLGPLITNQLPVELFFEIQPEEIRKDVKITIDGIFFDGIPKKVDIDRGKHTVKVECPGYHSRMISYYFKESSQFIVRGDMIKKSDSKVSVTIVDPVPGSVYADGKFISEISENTRSANGTLNVFGTPIIGQFRAVEKGTKIVREKVVDDNGKERIVEKEKQGDSLSFFYYVPENLQVEGANLAVKGKPMDHASYIDNRRIWTYRAYTLLVLSMPFTLFTVGKYNAAVNAYNASSLNTLDEVERWEKSKKIATSITTVCACLFGLELIRYLYAANSVLPEIAHKASALELEKSEKKLQEIFPVVEKDAAAAVDEDAAAAGKDIEEKSEESAK